MNCYFRQRWRDERLQFDKEVGVLSLSTNYARTSLEDQILFSIIHNIPIYIQYQQVIVYGDCFPDGSIWYSSR